MSLRLAADQPAEQGSPGRRRKGQREPVELASGHGYFSNLGVVPIPKDYGHLRATWPIFVYEVRRRRPHVRRRPATSQDGNERRRVQSLGGRSSR